MTPLDWEDIRDLAVMLDDLVDDAEEAGKLLVLFRLEGEKDAATLLARILHEQTLMRTKAMPLLATVSKHGDEIRRLVLETHRLESEADDTLDQALGLASCGVDAIDFSGIA